MQELICVLTTRWGAHFGGINVFNREMCIGLKESQPNVKLICIVNELNDSEILDAKSHNIKLIKIVENTYPIEIINTLNSQQIFPTTWIGHDMYTGQLAIDCSKLNISRSAVISHFDYEYYGSYKGNSGKVVEEKMLKQKQILSDADIRFSVGPKLKETVSRLTHKHPVVLNPGCFKSNVSPSELNTGFFAMASGRLETSDDNIKRISIVMDAYSKISKEIYVDKMLTIFGIEKSQVENISSNNVNSVLNIKALEFSSDKEHIFQTLAKQTMFIMPSLHEGFGLTGLEAISMEVPLILTSNSGLYSMLLEHDLLDYVYVINMTGDDIQDSTEIYNAMKYVFLNADKYKKLAIELKLKLNDKITWKLLGESIINEINAFSLKTYFPVKNKNDIDDFKTSDLFENLYEYIEYLFIEYRKILDKNNGLLEKKYGYILYQMISEYQNYINVQKELDDKQKLAEEPLNQRKQDFESILENVNKIDFHSFLDEAVNEGLENSLETLQEVANNASKYNIENLNFLEDLINELDTMKQYIESNINDIENNEAQLESFERMEVGKGYVPPEAYLTEGMDIETYRSLLSEIESLYNKINKFNESEDYNLDSIEEELKEIEEERKDDIKNSLFNLNNIFDYLNNKSSENIDTQEEVYINYCLLVCEKLKNGIE
jgi:hypothetical protein